MSPSTPLLPSPLALAAPDADAGVARKSLLLGCLAVALFSLTAPLTRKTVPYLDPSFVALGRGAVAGVVAALYLFVTRAALPTRRQWRDVAIAASGVVIGFPLAMGWAMSRVPAGHVGVVLGVLPLATAFVGSRIANERPQPLFWIAGAAGSAAVLVFASRHGHAGLDASDAALLLAVVAAAIGYAFSGRLARELGGAQVICWALVACLPLTVPATLLSMAEQTPRAPADVWLGFAYLALVSQLAGFFVWNRALALGGIARVSQTQLLQPFLTVLAAAWLVGEPIEGSTLAFAAIVIGCVAIGRRGVSAPAVTEPKQASPS